MTIVCLAVGKRHDTKLADAINDYTERLQRFARTEWQFVPSPHAVMPVEAQKAAETKQLLAAIKPGDVVVLLDERGMQRSTPQFAQFIQKVQLQSPRRLVLVIGGAHGVTPVLRQRADAVWSLSPLVFPHQLVRLILAEQLYRASTIVRGEPYHHV